MDEEKAGVEDLLRRGEELLHQTSDEGQREELRLLLLRLQSQYSAHRVRCLKYKLCLHKQGSWSFFFFTLANKSPLSYCVFVDSDSWVMLCLSTLGAEGAANQAGGCFCGVVVLHLHRADKRVFSRGEVCILTRSCVPRCRFTTCVNLTLLLLCCRRCLQGSVAVLLH